MDEAPPVVAPVTSVRRDVVSVNDDPSFIDMLLVYNPEVHQELVDEAGVAAQIDNFISFLNLTLANSGVGTRVRLVHAEELPVVLPSTCLELLVGVRDMSDGFLDEVHPLRDAYGADLVYMLFFPALDHVGCAFAPRPPRPDTDNLGFSVSLPLDTYVSTFAHEVGHNLGGAHD